MMPVANAIPSPALIGAANASRVSSRGTNVTPTSRAARSQPPRWCGAAAAILEHEPADERGPQRRERREQQRARRDGQRQRQREAAGHERVDHAEHERGRAFAEIRTLRAPAAAREEQADVENCARERLPCHDLEAAVELRHQPNEHRVECREYGDEGVQQATRAVRQAAAARGGSGRAAWSPSAARRRTGDRRSLPCSRDGRREREV